MTQIVPSADRLGIQTRADEQNALIAQEQAKFDAEREELYQEIEPFLTWLEEADEDEIVTQMSSGAVLQGLGGIMDDEERKAMFAKMHGGGGGGKGIGKGAVGKAIGAGKAAEKGMGKTVGKGVGGKGVGSGIGRGVGKVSATARSVKTGTASKLYTARMNHHGNAAKRDLQSAKDYRESAKVHKSDAIGFQKIADFHRGASTTGKSAASDIASGLLDMAAHSSHVSGGKAAGLSVASGLVSGAIRGSAEHKALHREAQAMADHHTALSEDHKQLARYHASRAQEHSKAYAAMKRNSPYKTGKG